MNKPNASFRRAEAAATACGIAAVFALPPLLAWLLGPSAAPWWLPAAMALALGAAFVCTPWAAERRRQMRLARQARGFRLPARRRT